jgi:hypothetical protein
MTDDFDDALRSRLQQSEPAPSSDAHNVLGQLKPAMRRARIRRGVAVSAATLSLLGVSVIGLAAIATSLSQQTSELDILVDGDPLPEPTAQTATTAPDAEETAEDRSREEQTETDIAISSLPATTIASSDSTTTSVAPSSTATPATTPARTQSAPTDNPSTTPSAATPPASPTQRKIQSNCGSITVSYGSNSVTLTSTQPGAGFAADVKSSGPEEVEVGFENGDAECEIKTRIESGTLETDIDNHDDDESDDGDDDDDDESDDDDDDGSGA